MYDNSLAASVGIIANKTLAVADAGVQQRLTVDGLTLTLPSAAATPAGTEFIIKNGGVKPTSAGPNGLGANKTVGFVVAPNSADGIAGLNIATPALTKGITYPKATGYVNDTLVLRCTGVAGVNGWVVAAAASRTAFATQFARTP